MECVSPTLDLETDMNFGHCGSLLIAACLISMTLWSPAIAQNPADLRDLRPNGWKAGQSFVDRIHLRCVDEYLVAPGIAECLLEEEKWYGDQLAKVYRQLVSQQNSSQEERLRKSQRSWLQYQSKRPLTTAAAWGFVATG